MFFQAARQGENYWWQYLITLFVVFLGWQVFGAIPLLIGLIMSVPEDAEPMEAMAAFAESMDFAAVGMDPLVGLTLMIVAFGFGLLSLWLMVRAVHKRPFQTLITPRPAINYRKIFTAAGLWFAFMAAFEVVSYLVNPENYVLQFEISRFLPLLLIAVFLLPIQTSFEELLMRGYLMQGIGLGFRNRLVPLIITSAIFGAMHFANPEVQEFGFGIMMVNYISIGAMLGIITLMDDGLELALGVHAANNIYGATMVTFSASALKTPAVFSLRELDVQTMTAATVIGSLIFILLLSKIYGWRDWSRLYADIPPAPMANNETFENHSTK